MSLTPEEVYAYAVAQTKRTGRARKDDQRMFAAGIAHERARGAWQPIKTAPIQPFDAENWYMSASPNLLLWSGHWVTIGGYGYTQRGRGRWRNHAGTLTPTHWMPLPQPPQEAPADGGQPGE